MDLLQLKYFCDAAETQNFSYTAKKYFVPPSSISQSIKRLEQELGVDLFEHMGNKVLLAETGKQFYEKIKCALNLIEEAKSTASESGPEIRGEISLLVSNNRSLVSKAIEAFRQRYPNVNFKLTHTKDDDMTYDIAVSVYPLTGYSEKGLLVEEDILLAMSNEHPLANKAEITESDLFGEKFISMPKHNSLYDVTVEICSHAGFLPDIAIQSPDPYYIRKYVELGMGIAFVPSRSWEGMFSENIVLRSIKTYKRQTHIFLPNNKRLKPSVAAFLQFLDVAGAM